MDFTGVRLTDRNIDRYLNQEYGAADGPKATKRLGSQALRQIDYGEDNDCTLTAITEAIRYYIPAAPPQEIYNVVVKWGKRFGYNSRRGTSCVMINSIYDNSLYELKAKKKVRGYNIKGLNYRYEDIVISINKGNPVVLNIYKDGRDLYNNHSILVIGYLTVGKAKMLIVHDNWYTNDAFVDYTKLSRLASVQIVL